MSDNFADLNQDDQTEKPAEQVQTSAYTVQKTGIQKGIIQEAFIRKSGSSKSKALHITIQLDSGATVQEDLWVSNKAGDTFYIDKNTGAKVQLPNFTLADDLVSMLTGKSLVDGTLNFADKLVDMWNADKKARVPTPVPMLMDILEKPILVAIREEIHDKTTKNAAGEYVPNGEFRVSNAFEKFFDAGTRKTAQETREGSEAVYADKFLDAHKDTVFDRRCAENKGKPLSGAAATTPESGTTGVDI